MSTPKESRPTLDPSRSRLPVRTVVKGLRMCHGALTWTCTFGSTICSAKSTAAGCLVLRQRVDRNSSRRAGCRHRPIGDTDIVEEARHLHPGCCRTKLHQSTQAFCFFKEGQPPFVVNVARRAQMMCEMPFADE